MRERAYSLLSTEFGIDEERIRAETSRDGGSRGDGLGDGLETVPELEGLRYAPLLGQSI